MTGGTFEEIIFPPVKKKEKPKSKIVCDGGRNRMQITNHLEKMGFIW